MSEPKTNEPHRHHVLPQFHMRGFAKDGFVELIERADPTRATSSTVKKALFKEHFYSLDTPDGHDTFIETFFANKVESPAAKAIRRLVYDGRPIVAPGIRTPISLFIAIQHMRGTGPRAMLVEHLKAVARKMASHATAESFLEHARESGESISEEEARDLAEYARAGNYNLDVNHQANLHLAALKHAEFIARLLYDRVWRLVEFDEPLLVTCDEPVSLVGPDMRKPGNAGGFARAEVVLFPLDARHMLEMVRPDLPVDESRLRGDAKLTRTYNLHTAFSAHEVIVRYPGTDPLRDLVIPRKAPAVFTIGDVIGMGADATVEAREKFLARVARGEVRFREAPSGPRDPRE